MNVISTSHSLFEIDTEIDALLEQIQDEAELLGEPSRELTDLFRQFCQAHGEKVDRLGRFVRMMEAREQFCRSEAARLTDRARSFANKASRTKSMVLFYLMSRGLRKIEGREHTLRVQKNSQDSVKILNEDALPTAYCRIDLRLDGVLWETILSLLPDELIKSLSSSVQGRQPNAAAIIDASSRSEQVPGAEVLRGSHLRVA